MAFHALILLGPKGAVENIALCPRDLTNVNAMEIMFDHFHINSNTMLQK